MIGDVRNADGTVRTEVFLAADKTKHNLARTVYVSEWLQREIECYVRSGKWTDDTLPLFYT